MIRVPQRLRALLFWAPAAFALVMALLPRPPQLPGAPSDKIQHIIAFAVLTLLARIAWPALPWLRIALGLSLFGALIEAFQLIPALHRDGDVVDWAADTAAILTVLLLIALAKRLWPSA